MQKAMASMADWFAARGYGQVQLSVGLNTGPMSVGVYGGATHLAWSAQGQAFNVASRIESLTREVGHNLLMGEATALLIAPEQVARLGEYQVKSVAERIPVYTVNAEINNI
jgi:adenylate cyclase